MRFVGTAWEPIRNLRQRPLAKRLGVKGPTEVLCVTVANTGLISARAKKSTEKRNRAIESNGDGDSDSLFSAFLDVRSRRVKEELAAREVRVCHPGCFCFKCAQAAEKQGDSKTVWSKRAQAYRRKGLRLFSDWAERWWDNGRLTGSGALTRKI
jgi:hypothetical protein